MKGQRPDLKNFIYRKPVWVPVLIIALASSLIGLFLVPLIKDAPGDTYAQVAALVVIPSFLISTCASTPTVYLYRKIIRENYEMIDRLEKDYLTGLLNRHTFFKRYKSMIEECCRYNYPITLLMMDIDDFKIINDTHGHTCGDHVIKLTASRLSENLRKDDLVCRFGGEEFLIVLKNATENEAKECAERLLQSMRKITEFNETCISFTVSIGLVYDPNCSLNSDTYIAKADKALYEAKNSGKDRIVTNI